MTRTDLIRMIETFAQSWGIAPATVTSRAVGNSRLYQRMLDGGGCTLGIAEKLIAYMDQNPPPAGARPAEKDVA